MPARNRGLSRLIRRQLSATIRSFSAVVQRRRHCLGRTTGAELSRKARRRGAGSTAGISFLAGRDRSDPRGRHYVERELLEALGQADELRAFFHDGFWQPMDTVRDRVLREEQ